VLDDAIRIWCAVRIVGLDLTAADHNAAGDEGRADEAHTQRHLCGIAHDSSSLKKIFALY